MYYHNITIDESVLSQLPLDGDIANVPTVVDKIAVMPESQSRQEDSNDELLAETFVLRLLRQTTEEMIRQTIDGTRVSRPHINQTPLNEFRTEGYVLSISNCLSYR